MKLIVGIGNPGKTYEKTRHNVGFMAIDELAKNPVFSNIEKSLEFRNEKKFCADIAEVNIKGEKIILAKPQTYVNRSGEAVKKIASFYKIKPIDTLIVADDLELPLGKIRIRLSGSSGGHKGIESVIDGFDTTDFIRIRIGIGPSKTVSAKKEFKHFPHTPVLDAKEYVLEKFSKREMPIVENATRAISKMIAESLNRCDGLEAHTLDVF